MDIGRGTQEPHNKDVAEYVCTVLYRHMTDIFRKRRRTCNHEFTTAFAYLFVPWEHQPGVCVLDSSLDMRMVMAGADVPNTYVSEIPESVKATTGSQASNARNLELFKQLESRPEMQMWVTHDCTVVEGRKNIRRVSKGDNATVASFPHILNFFDPAVVLFRSWAGFTSEHTAARLGKINRYYFKVLFSVARMFRQIALILGVPTPTDGLTTRADGTMSCTTDERKKLYDIFHSLLPSDSSYACILASTLQNMTKADYDKKKKTLEQAIASRDAQSQRTFIDYGDGGGATDSLLHQDSFSGGHGRSDRQSLENGGSAVDEDRHATEENPSEYAEGQREEDHGKGGSSGEEAREMVDRRSADEEYEHESQGVESSTTPVPSRESHVVQTEEDVGFMADQQLVQSNDEEADERKIDGTPGVRVEQTHVKRAEVEGAGSEHAQDDEGQEQIADASVEEDSEDALETQLTQITSDGEGTSSPEDEAIQLLVERKASAIDVDEDFLQAGSPRGDRNMHTRVASNGCTVSKGAALILPKRRDNGNNTSETRLVKSAGDRRGV